MMIKLACTIARRSISLMLVAGAAWLLMPMPANASTNTYTTNFDGKTLTCVQLTSIETELGYDLGNGSNTNVQMCLVPQLEPEAEHTVIVDQSSVQSLEAQGSFVGLCPDWISETEVAGLPSCTAADGTTGVWVPDGYETDGASLNAYFHQVVNGHLSGLPDASNKSYREIKGE